MVYWKIRAIWQEQWQNESKGRNLFCVNPEIDNMRHGGRNGRIGHTRLNKALFIMGKYENGRSKVCREDQLKTCQQFRREVRRVRKAFEEKIDWVD